MAFPLSNLIFCHLLLPAVLAKLFNLMICAGHVRASFRMSFTVPVPKSNVSRYSESLTEMTLEAFL